MATMGTTELLDVFKNMTVLELNEFLKAFDNAREQIYEVADKVYRRGGGGKGTYAYVLAEEDF